MEENTLVIVCCGVDGGISVLHGVMRMVIALLACASSNLAGWVGRGEGLCVVIVHFLCLCWSISVTPHFGESPVGGRDVQADLEAGKHEGAK